MNREETPKKPRKKKAGELDEMQMDVQQKSGHIGMITGLVMCLVVTVIKLMTDDVWQDLFSVYCAALSGQFLYKWLRMKSVSLLICAIVWGVCALGFFIAYLHMVF